MGDVNLYIALLWRLNELIYGKCLDWCLPRILFSSTILYFIKEVEKETDLNKDTYSVCVSPSLVLPPLYMLSPVWLCDPMDCSLQGSSVHGIFLARILEWIAIPSAKGSSWPRDLTHISCVSCIAGEFLTTEPLGKPQWGYLPINS